MTPPTDLRDALAAALLCEFYSTGDETDYRLHADAILADPAFRAALTEAIAVGLAGGPESVAEQDADRWEGAPSILDMHDEWWETPNDLAAAIVARMLP